MQIKILQSDYEKQLGFKLREEVFVKEQNVPMELELDEKDSLETTIHVVLFNEEGILAGVARILDMGSSILHIGRVAIKKDFRGMNLGYELIQGCHNIIKEESPIIPVRVELGAQAYAEKFYQKLGYERLNDEIYIDAGIEHIDMGRNIF